LSLLLTLIVTPVAYSFFDDISRTHAWRRFAARVYGLTHPFRRRVQSAVTRRAADDANDLEPANDELKARAGSGD
jgi:hypothetical protein